MLLLLLLLLYNILSRIKILLYHLKRSKFVFFQGLTVCYDIWNKNVNFTLTRVMMVKNYQGVGLKQCIMYPDMKKNYLASRNFWRYWWNILSCPIKSPKISSHASLKCLFSAYFLTTFLMRPFPYYKIVK